ncbi:MAG: hypothetical protein JSS00_02325 [Proteobacteria bacterium]|nr:hypothetical protein [Pseudomonadota bacterium]
MRWLCAVVLTLLLPAAANAATAQAPARDCFISSNWRGWSASRQADVLYLRVLGNDIYRVELTPGSHVRRYGGEFLVNQIRGSSWICSALDLDLALSDYNGFSRPLIATDLRRLTPEEVAAIPREDLPY